MISKTHKGTANETKIITQPVEVTPSIACRYPKKQNLVNLRTSAFAGLALLVLLIALILTSTNLHPRTVPPVVTQELGEDWSATFESPDEWKLQGFNYALDFDWDPYFAPKITNGVLKMPNTQDKWYISQAIHPSTVAYGTWSFDWYVSAGTSHEAYEVIFFIVNDYFPTEQSGESTTDMNGYVLILTSNEEGVNLNAPYKRAVTLSECHSTSKIFNYLAFHQFPSALEGLYHIDITRDITGEFNIYFDKEHLFQVTDNTTTISEEFVFGSWYGDTTYDNLTVSNTVDIDPPSFHRNHYSG
ncbi:MAG: hypothetical protein ACXADY_19735 [Candidatus Hodarchaeales archaeon]